MQAIAKGTVAVLVVIVAEACVWAQDFTVMARHYNYDQESRLDIQQVSLQERVSAAVYDITYASAMGGRVPAYVVVPEGKGPFAAIVWGHWMMDGSPYRNRTEFLAEALVLAKSGVVSLLIDAPMVRAGFKEDPNPLGPQPALNQQQQVLDVRRGVDLLVTRNDVDPERLGYVGHSFNAGVGGLLAGVEKRFKAFVIMAGGLSDMQSFNSGKPRVEAFKNRVGAENLRKVLEKFNWTDPYYFVSRPGHAPLLLQYANRDQFLTDKDAEQYLNFIPEPRELKVYNADHALNAEARRDRVEWLRMHLGFGKIDETALAKTPQIR